MFSGTYQNSSDDKGRVSIPSRIRSIIKHQGQPEHLYITPAPRGNLNAYTEKDFREIIDTLSSRRTREASDFLRQFSAAAEISPMDKQGRLVITDPLRVKAGLKKDIVILGVAQRLEIWDKAAFDKDVEGGASLKDMYENAKDFDLPAGLI